jgi:transcriptional regulator with XRE-family HTH domain
MIKIKDLEFNTLAEKIKNCRLDKGLTQGQLAIKTGINRSSIANYENDRCDPSVKNFLIICKALDINEIN